MSQAPTMGDEPQAFQVAASYVLCADGSVAARSIRIGTRLPGHPTESIYTRELNADTAKGRWEGDPDDPHSVFASQILLPVAEGFLAAAARLGPAALRHDAAPSLLLHGLRFELEFDYRVSPAGNGPTHLACTVIEELSDPGVAPRRSFARLSMEEETLVRREFRRPLNAETFDVEGRVREVVEDDPDWLDLRLALADRLEAALIGLLDQLDTRGQS